MSRILLYLILAGTGAVSLVAPWIGVIAYYILVLGNPQAVLFWVFADMRTSVSTSVPVILGLIGQAVLRRVSVSVLFDRQSVFVLLILVSAVVSYVFSPFGHNEAPSVIQNSNYLVTTLAKIVLFYFVAIALINDERKLHLLTLVIVGTIVYYTYWSNAEYLVYGLQSYRLAGPSIGSAAMYSDENYFCAVLVC